MKLGITLFWGLLLSILVVFTIPDKEKEQIMPLKIFVRLHFIVVLALIILGGTLFLFTQSSVLAAGKEHKPKIARDYITADKSDIKGLDNQLNLIRAQQITRPTYASAVVLLEDLGNTTPPLLSPYTHFTNTHENTLGLFSILKEGATYYLWLGSTVSPTPCQVNSREQRFESQDGLTWRNRTDTSLIWNSTSCHGVRGIRQVIKTGSIYEGWEEYDYEVSAGWGRAIRYITSTNGLSWTVVNQPALNGATTASVTKMGGSYHLWQNPSADAGVYNGSWSLRHRVSNSGGSGWGNWQTGGTIVSLDGTEEIAGATRVRQLANNSYQLFYFTDTHLNLATSTDGLSFTTQITNLLDLTEVLPTGQADSLIDFAVIEVEGEDWVYFSYCTSITASGFCGTAQMAVSRPLGPELENSCVAPPGNLISWWPGDGSTADAADGNSGLLQNGATFAPGKVGQAFSFDGVNDFVRVAKAPNLDMTNSVTLDFWMRGDPSNPMNTCCQGLVTTDFYGIEISGGFTNTNVGINFFISTNSGASFHHTSDVVEGAYSMASGEWHHVAGVYDGAKLLLYIDGQVQAQTPLSGTISPMLTNSFLTIGSESGRTTCAACGNRYFKGLIDEVELHNRALSANEIQGIFNAGSAGKCKIDLAVNKTSSTNPVDIGDSLTYTLEVVNNGPLTATNVSLVDILPAGVTFVTANPGAPTCAETGGTLNCNLGSMPRGLTTTVSVGVAVNLTGTATITNTASVTATEGDSTLSNNSDFVTNTVRLNNPPPQTCAPGQFSAYGPAVNLIEELANGSRVELAPAFSPGIFGQFSFLKEGDSHYLWVSNLQQNGASYISKEQRFQSQDGLVWRNRADTNLTLNSSFYQHLIGLHQVLKSGSLYEGWETYYYEVVSGGWAASTRYVTSPDGLTWTIVNQPILATANVANVIKEGSTYHLWAMPDVDSNVDPDRTIRYRTSSSGGTGWGHWKTGGSKITIDGVDPGVINGPRVRRLPDGTYQLFYLSGNNLNLATSSNGVNFTNQVIGLLDITQVLSVTGLSQIGDMAVVEVNGEDWIYFNYLNNNLGERRVGVSRPVKNCNNNLSLSKTVTPTVAIPGQRITYTLTFTNEGPGIAQGVVITDLVPVKQVSNLSYSASGVVVTPTGNLSYTWQVSDLAAGQSGKIILTGIVSPNLSLSKSIDRPTTPTLIINKASITGTGTEVDPLDNHDTVSTTVILPQVQFKALNYSVVENKGPAVITVTVAPPPLLTVTVRLISADGTASHLSDYKSISQSLTFAPGVASLTITMLISDDTLVEGAEHLILSLSQPDRAALGLYTTATLTLLDNDRASTPVNQVYLPLVLQKASDFPIFIGSPIPTRPVNPVGKTFYSRWVDIPQSLPQGGRFYFSSRPDQVAEIFVDDRVVVSLSNGGEIFSYQSFKGQTNFVEVSRAVLEQMAGKSVLVEYKDKFGSSISATEVWLIWVP